MAGSSSNLDLVSSSQASKEITVNALVDACSPATIYGRRASTTTGLTWGFYGGYISIAGTPTSIANGTVALTGSTTNYVVASRATGAVSTSTATTNWDSASYIRLYAIVTGASSVTSYTDHRTLLNAETPYGALQYQGTWDADTNTPTLASGTGTKGYYYAVSVAGTTSLDGIASWSVGDWAIYNGTAWQKLEGGITSGEIVAALGYTPQTQDATLTSLALLGTAADKLAYTTGVDTWAETAFTAAARTVLDDATVSAMVDTLGGATSTGTGGLVRKTAAAINPTSIGATTPGSGAFTTLSSNNGSITSSGGSLAGFTAISSITKTKFRWDTTFTGAAGATRNYGAYTNYTNYADWVLRVSTAEFGDPDTAGATLLRYYNSNFSVTGSISATTTIRTGGYTVGTLPAGATGDRAYVTDATTPTYLGALTGGGAVVCPVFKNASAWVSA